MTRKKLARKPATKAAHRVGKKPKPALASADFDAFAKRIEPEAAPVERLTYRNEPTRYNALDTAPLGNLIAYAYTASPQFIAYEALEAIADELTLLGVLIESDRDISPAILGMYLVRMSNRAQAAVELDRRMRAAEVVS